ncbi:low temperature requirement protein A [Rhodococcus sp. WB9]|uniref:low temperature requirement protein A n=1 Tax=Rhodococcus sp. WB9 TaxID=2594007 RepID=UPI001185BC2C|nr:low temperature requirement protein A [Rhodococcus sp. WB9]QDQ95065.1 low temperature requirement protein A [Rhodococcus sp. WB9]
MSASGKRSLQRDLGDQHVSPLELFFDLVYVFAIGQLSHHLLDYLTWTGLVETVVLYLAVFLVWAYTSWAGTLTDPEQSPVRMMLLVIMVLGLFMNVAIAEAFGEAGWLFVAAYLTIQLGRTIWLLTTGLGDVMHRHFQRTLVWLLATAPLWIAGAVIENSWRLLLWSGAAVIDLAGLLSAHPLPGKRIHSERVDFASEHHFERTRLFFIIALGETVLTTGAAVAGAPMGPMTLFTGAVAVIGTIALWWAYFRRSERAAVSQAVTNRDPVRIGHHATNALLVMVAGLLAIAVGDELVIAHPTGHTNAATNALLFGGPFLFFAAQSWYMRMVMNDVPVSRPIALVSLVVLAVATLPGPTYAAACAAAAVVLGVAFADGRRAAVEEASGETVPDT